MAMKSDSEKERRK